MVDNHIVLVGHSVDRDGTEGVRIEPHPSTLERIADYRNIDVHRAGRLPSQRRSLRPGIGRRDLDEVAARVVEDRGRC